MTTAMPMALECTNCGASLSGAYCHACGQKAVSSDVSLHDFAHEAMHEFGHLDGKIVRTLRLLVAKPGMLTREFLAGRRSRYISPLRVYLTCSALFFALAALAPNPSLSFFRVTYKASPGDAPIDSAAVQRYEQESTSKASRAVVHDFPRAMFALMPVYGLLTWVLYRKSRPFYAAHLYYSIHFHAFAFLALTLEVSLILATGRRIPGIAWLAPVALLVWHFIGLRRVFGGSRLTTVWKGTLLWFVYALLILSTIVLVGVRSIRGTAPGAPPSEVTSKP
jgi:hypothetical protein